MNRYAIVMSLSCDHSPPSCFVQLPLSWTDMPLSWIPRFKTSSGLVRFCRCTVLRSSYFEQYQYFTLWMILSNIYIPWCLVLKIYSKVNLSHEIQIYLDQHSSPYHYFVLLLQLRPQAFNFCLSSSKLPLTWAIVTMCTYAYKVLKLSVTWGCIITLRSLYDRLVKLKCFSEQARWLN